jgi:hypothetical protein
MTIKTCVNCVFVTTVINQRGTLHCGHPAAVVSIDLVTGEKTIYSCAQMRENQKCGASGQLFEAKENSQSENIKNKFLRWFTS